MYAVAECYLDRSLILGISGNKIIKDADDAVLDAPVILSFGNELLNGFLIAFLTALQVLQSPESCLIRQELLIMLIKEQIKFNLLAP